MMENRRLYMDKDRPISVVPYIGELLDEGIPVLVYNGDRDMVSDLPLTSLRLFFITLSLASSRITLTYCSRAASILPIF